MRHFLSSSTWLRAALLATPVVAFGQAAHGDLLASHLLIDASLALPLAALAIVVTGRAGRARGLLAGTAFAALVIPGAFGHAWLHQDAGHAHTAKQAIAHAIRDATGMLPVAVAAGLLAVHVGVLLRNRRAVAFVLAPVAAVSSLGGSLQPAVANNHAPFKSPLRIPPVRTEEDISIRMQRADVPILPGAPTSMWTYDGVFPGPTIRRPSGRPTRVTFVNDLPDEVGETTVHHHGNHSASLEDGQPHSQLIAKRASRTYTYDFMEDGAPERAAFQWYHDHRMDVTGRNVWMGLAGMVILDDPVDLALPLPKGEHDVPLMITDRAFDSNNQLQYTFSPNGVRGNQILVNGVVQPYFEVGDRKYRLRLLNASNDRAYDLAFDDGRPMVQVATESGLLPAPVTRTHIRLGPAERAEVVVDFAGALGKSPVLRNLLGFGTTGQVMQFSVTADVNDDSAVPAALRPLPELDDGPLTRTRTWVLGAETEPELTWTINGRAYDPHRVDTAPLNPVLNTSEKWIFVNATTADHLVHIHDVDWRLIDRVSAAPPDAETQLAEQGLKETFLVRPGEVITVAARFTDHLGQYVLHCHLLEHEDKAMMASFEVVAS